jgi:hypothetical protein
MESFNENYGHPLPFKEIDNFHAQKCECTGAIKSGKLRYKDVFRKRGLHTRVTELEKDTFIFSLPIAVAARSKARTVFALSNTKIVGSNPT